MPKSLPLRVDPVLLREARKRAKAAKQTLAEYVETALREKLKRAQRKSARPAIELRGPIPPGKLRKSKPAPIPGETKRQREKRDRLFHTLLDLSGVSR